MHRDHKIGLALAVLLIGLAAALCFPRTRLLPTADLDSVAVKTDNRHAAAPPVEIARSDVRDDTVGESSSIQPTPSDDAFSESTLPEGVADIVVATPPQGVPQPTSVHPDATEDARQPEVVPSPAKPKPVLYTIQLGDTLSGLAYRFLGSSARYQELFEANRDVLSSPDRLEPGVQIRIPTQDSRRTDADADDSGATELSTTPAGFQHPSRTPFDVRRR